MLAMRMVENRKAVKSKGGRQDKALGGGSGWQNWIGLVGEAGGRIAARCTQSINNHVFPLLRERDLQNGRINNSQTLRNPFHHGS